MRPSPTEYSGSQRTERDRPDCSPSSSAVATTRAVGSEDSWIEIPSHPSSTSLSSTANDIVTTGLSVRSQEERLSRQFRTSAHQLPREPRATSTTGSSQDEYEESESESDRIMSSSNEDIDPDAAGDDDDTSTALGVRSINRVFTPQPNAFSHPPSSQLRPIPDSYFPAVQPSDQHANRTITQRSYQHQTRTRSHPAMSSYQPDHDAALRASLTTLLSCAAAVRPKGQPSRNTTTRPPAQPTSLRLVPESELETASQPRRTTSSPKQQKRKSRESSKERQVKKVRAAKTAIVGEELISPTLASWMISAGVVLVFSAISFSAGYAWGRDVGRIEGELGLTGGGCSQEAVRGSGTGLRRLRWSSGASSVRA
ncbi:uncharacterized protein A1O9_01286 [Exophiala aquamarina CBS 119918]|uniref:Uncharacterized protein n=1 Tax=Exophiala aquamarina CBS 119918 TaxID=1182545 RepID=A0A072PTB9_9EURO|nr:uncharacterized protein A1O9_01286 [Exophiala aquamarina CBS 119918]KEF63309.1 hypothetical protein A1O9_01286 [Exophiala aquamarina CBS 119918]